MTTTASARPIALGEVPFHAILTVARTIPNLVTLSRTAGAVLLGVAAVALERPVLTLVGYAVYWFGDVADGWLARRLGQETRLGAVLDIVSDRACTAVLAAGLVMWLPESWLVVGVFLLSFMVLDTALSLAFLAWPLLGPNDFHRVDVLVWRWNWSPPAKALNTAAVVLLLVLGLEVAALVVILAVLGVKAWSADRVLGLFAARTAGATAP